ncbi:transmembrane protein, putative [Rhizoctonia solani AG-3 Rhs1AP]|uniref:Transmembrane protein, putative n=2 Tax=Rhizoctonia solani AG-3 TaxID=1086053 RepID=A0A0A1UIP0_9AGAM|nr:transmembrane protein, putative [Rhizoctonia solani AG-3 Rhs1AP]KEP50093.1 putative transmembrane protein [Rhizoctonia solani 123E]
MSRRFVAPSVEPRGSTSSIQTIASPIPSTPRDYLPPPSHPALARPRIPSPGPETYGALNRPPLPPPSHPSRGPSPAPPLPSRTPSHTMHSVSPAPMPTHNLAVVSPRPQTNTSYSLDSVTTQPEPRLSAQIVSSSDVSTPVLLVTPVTASGTIDGLPNFQKTETLPPYSSEADISQTWPVIEAPPIVAPVPTNRNALGLQNQGYLSMGNLPPPSHPSRQPSPALIVDNPGLRHRAHSSTNIGSARTLDSDTLPRRPLLEHSRRGSGASVLTLKDSNLTDDDLRKMYDAEEVERYLRLFASRVNEVTMDLEHPEAQTPMQEDDGEWISVSDPAWPCVRKPSPLPPHLANPQTFFQYIAAIIYPYVVVPRPQSTETKRKFKLNRAASAAQRLYLAAYPAYVPTLVYLGHLATWRDPRKSGLWCAVFWAAWAGGFLSQLIVGRLLYALYTGGHVTRDEIRRRRTAAKEAEKLGKAIQGGIPGVGVTGQLGVWEVTKLVTGLGKKKGKKVKAAAVEFRNDVTGQDDAERPEDKAEDMEDWKLMLVDLADELADLHERIKNIFLHRRPELTRFYIILLTLLFMGTFIIQNTSKIITMVIGFWFWFIPPIIKQLPKLPSPFAEAPTDAEVAMELISKRVERGERVVPERISKRKKTKPIAEPGKLVVPSGTSSKSTVDLTDSSFIMSPSTTSLVDGTSSDDEADVGLVVTSHTSAPQEDKLRKGAVRAWNWLGRTKQLIDQTRGVESKKIHAHASPEQSFPAQHRSRPGMLMISSELLTFTPLFTSSNQSQTPQDPRTIKVDIDHLRGVKRISPGGLSVRYVKGSEVVEEKFLLVVGRDEAFATLVGWGGGRWKHV